MRRVVKIIVCILLFFVGAFWGLLTIYRFAVEGEIAGSYIFYDGTRTIANLHKHQTVMPPSVVDYKTDGKFITVKQYADSIYILDYKLIDYPDDELSGFYYWIIDVKEDIIVGGPLKYEQFRKECDLRGLSRELIF